MSSEAQEGVDEPVVDDPAQHHRVPQQDEVEPESEECLDDVHRRVESASQRSASRRARVGEGSSQRAQQEASAFHIGTVGRWSDNVKLSDAKILPDSPLSGRPRATSLRLA